LLKKISHNTNKHLGDNTTTSVVIGTEIYLEGLKFLRYGGNPIIMKKGMEKAKTEV